jgi:hypothetical protein
VNLSSVRYVRTRAVTQSSQWVALVFSIPIVGDPRGRTHYSASPLKPVDDTTFIAESASGLFVPIDTECTFAVEDLAVSPNRIGADIYVNGTLIRRISAGDHEYGVFKVAADGRVY